MSASVMIFFSALRQDAGGVHFAGGQDQPVTQFLLEKTKCLFDRFIGDPNTGIAGEQNEIHAQISGFPGIFQRCFSAAGHGPHVFIRIFGG